MTPHAWRTGLLALLAVIAILMGTGLFIAWHHLSAQSDANTAVLQRLDRMEARTASRPYPMPRRVPAPSAAAVADANPPTQGLPASQVARAAQQAQARWQMTEAAFARESRNARWAGAAESDILGVVTGPALALVSRPDDLDVDCRAHSCRISADFRDPSAAQDWAQIFPVAAGATLPQARVLVIPRADGSAEVRIYAQPR